MRQFASIPVNVLTGYLGSGKTTLLKQLLQTGDASRTAVLINEFGEVSLDHLIVEQVSATTVVLQNGCVCCSIRSDLKAGLHALIDGSNRGDVPEFDMILIETTGLADPVPIVQTLVADPMLRHQVRLANLISTVDCMNGLLQLATQPEAGRQAATADRLVITKTDLAGDHDIERLHVALAAINPSASIVRAPIEKNLWNALLSEHAFDPARKSDEVRRWLGSVGAEIRGRHFEAVSVDNHTASIKSFVFRTRKQMDWTAFAVWLSLLVHRHGAKVLRVKGLLAVAGARGPILLNAVQNFVHPPVHIDVWPDEDISSRLVFILQDLDTEAVRASLEEFLELNN
jgi:G3E family GTPase